MYKLNNVYIGIVVNNQDWENRGRVQVFIPHLSNTLYKGWNESGEDIKFKSFDSSVFTPDIISRLTDVLPWSEMAMPFFGGGTGAPVNQSTYTPTPAPTFMTYGSTGGIAPSTSFPTGKNGYDLNAIVNNSNSGNSGSYFQGLKVNNNVNLSYLNSAYAQRAAGFANELKAAGYDVTIVSGYRPPTPSERSALNLTKNDATAQSELGGGSGVAPVYGSNHGAGIALDFIIKTPPNSSKKFGDINIYNLSTTKNGGNSVNTGGSDLRPDPPEYAALKQKWGLKSLGKFESWHLEPTEAVNGNKLFNVANNLNNNNVPAFSGSAIAQDGTATKQEFPKKDGMNNPSGDVSKSETVSAGISKLASDRQAKFANDMSSAETLRNFAYLAKREVGDNPDAQLAWMETVVNRAQFKNNSLADEIQGNLRYWRTDDYPDFRTSPKYKNFTQDKVPSFANNLNKILSGSNVTNLATDNASSQIGNSLARERIRAGFEGSWFKDGIAITDPNEIARLSNLEKSPDGVEFLYKGNGAKAAKKYASENGIETSTAIAGNNIMKPTDMFQNAGNGVAKIGGAGTAMGMFSIPQVGSKAYVMFLDGNPLKPIVVGCYQEPSNVRSS
jgi:hypothetical protein